MFDALDGLLILVPDSLDKYPKLKAFHGRMAAREKIAKYRQTDGFKKMRLSGKIWRSEHLLVNITFYCQYFVEINRMCTVVHKRCHFYFYYNFGKCGSLLPRNALYALRGIATVSRPPVCLSVCNDEYKLSYFENNHTSNCIGLS